MALDAAAAAPGSLAGTVMSTSGEAVAGATVAVGAPPTSAVSNSNEALVARPAGAEPPLTFVDAPWVKMTDAPASLQVYLNIYRRPVTAVIPYDDIDHAVTIAMPPRPPKLSACWNRAS